MLFDRHGVRLTRSELNQLRQANARAGNALNHVRSREELIDAIIHGLPESTQRDLHTFLEELRREANRTG